MTEKAKNYKYRGAVIKGEDIGMDVEKFRFTPIC